MTMRLVLLVAMCVTNVSFADERLSVDVAADLFGKYIWRGQNLNDDPVLQPSISLVYGALTGCIWGNMDLTGYGGNSGEMTEYDYSLDYTTALEVFEGTQASVGAINYDCVSLEDTTEIYYGIAIDWLLCPSVTLYHDVDDIGGAYAEFAINYEVEKIAEFSSNMPIGLETCVCLGWGSKSFNTGYWDEPVDGSSLSDLAFSAAFPVTIGNWTLSPNLNFVTILSSDMRKADTYDTASDYLFAGLNLSTSF